MSPDMLSDLPLGIIHIILSFLPIREAIGTSFLSRQWRYIWTSLPHLAFEDGRFSRRIETDSDIRKLIHFISQVLLLHEGPINTFVVRFPLITMSRAQLPCINQWLSLLSTNAISNLVLEFNIMDPMIEVLSSLYSCQNLTRLELCLYNIPSPPPFFKGFLFLRSLYVRMLGVDSSTIESIITHSPMLEDVMLACRGCSKMTFRAPNLKFLHFEYGFTHLSLCAPLLEELTLRFFTDTTQFSCHESLFYHLRIIDLNHVPFGQTKVAMAVIRLITRSPNLQKLDIDILFANDAPELACTSFWDIESARDFTYDSLKVINMWIWGCGIDDIKLVKFLLARSPALEKMIYRPGRFLSEQAILNLTAELMSCGGLLRMPRL